MKTLALDDFNMVGITEMELIEISGDYIIHCN